jgi:hypothetical protein
VRQSDAMSPLPTPARASIGMAAAAISAARELPRKLVELPVIAVGTALQLSLRAQQQYAEFIAKGDEILGQLRGIPDEPPSWATFDESPAAETRSSDRSSPATAEASQAGELTDAIEGEAMAELLEAEALAALEDAEADRIAEALDTAALATERPLEPPAGKAAAKKAAAKKAPAAPRNSRTAASGEASESPNSSEPPDTPPVGEKPTAGVDTDLPRD